MRFHKVLAALDFSEPSRVALDAAARMCAASGAELVLAHVWQPTLYSYGMPAFPVAVVEGTVEQVERRLGEARKAAEALGAKHVTTRALSGAPWHELVELLRHDRSFDLAVLGTHGHTGLEHVLLGSVAEKVVRHAPCAVLVVRTRA